MNDLAERFIDEVDGVSNDLQSLSFLCRAQAIHEEAIAKAKQFRDRAVELKNQAIALSDEDSANAMLSCENILSMHMHELQMYVDFKNDDAAAAWDSLIYAQGAARQAMQAHDIAGELDMWSERLHQLENLLFPRQMFFSIGMKVEEAICSICSSVYGECEHVVGRPYMGQVCSRILKRYSIEEISIVTNPASKLARIMAYTDEKGDIVDVLSRRVVNSNGPIAGERNGLRG